MNPNLPQPSFPDRTQDKTVRVLYEISDAANRCVDLNDLYRTIHKALGRILKVDNFFIALYHEETDAITFPYYVDEVDKDFNIIKNVSQKNSLTARVVKTGLAVLADEKQLLKLHTENPEKAIGTCAKVWAGAPMKIRGKAFGAIVLQDYKDPAVYRENDLNTLSTVSGFIALSIDRKREETARNESEKLNRILFSISNAVNTTLNLDEMFQTIHRILGDVIDVTNFAIGIYDRHKDMIFYPYYVDETGDTYSRIQDVSTSGILAAEVIQKKSAFFITKDEILKRNREKGYDYMGRISEQWLGVPLKKQNEVIGVIVVQNYKENDHFRKKDADILMAVSDQVAIAIDRKSAGEKIVENERMTQALYRISNAINTTDNLNDLFNSIYDSLNRLIELPNFFICIYQQQTNSMYFPFYVDEYDSEETISFTIEDIGMESSITTDVIHSKKPLFLTNEMLLQMEKEKRIVGKVPVIWLGIPLIIRDEVIGIMAVQHYSDPRYFTQEDMDLFVAVSDQIALAIDRKQSQQIIIEREKQILELSRQTEQLSLVAASIISMRDEKKIFNHISNAIVENSDYERLIISYFTDKPPYREILGYKGVDQSRLNKITRFNISKDHFEKILKKGKSVGHFACFLSQSDNDILSPKLLALFTGANESEASNSNKWHTNDMLFIPMNDANGNLMGAISVGKSKSGRLPTNETVRPLEIFSSLISQIIIVQKIQNELKDHKQNLEKRVAERTKELTQEITERIQIEKMLKKAKIDAEAAAQAKLEFLANMSHEIRTPINGVMGMAEIALEKDLDEDLRQIITTIDSEADQLLKIINEILDFSKIEAGKLEIEKIDFNICRVFEKTCTSLAMGIPQDTIEFISFFSPDIPPALIGDPGRLRQILVNLVGNAIKFTKKGEIFVAGELLKDHGRHVELKFTIKDTGIGIAREKQQTIFESFRQADGSTTRKYGGTGLGTTISKQIVELMGGRIGLESTPEKGSLFWFTAIFEKQAGQSAQAAKDTNNHLEGLRLLVVTDNVSNQFVFEKYLTSFGCRPHLVDTPEEALRSLEKKAVRKNSFDLVITDLCLPQTGKFNLARAIRSRPYIKDLPIIVLTSAGKAGDGNTCRDIGINGYLPKPVKKQELEMIIASVLGKAGDPGEARRKLVTRHSMAEETAGKLNILLVEDYPTNQKVAAKHLEAIGYRVTLAENGRQAYEFYKKKHFDLILMDIQMPEMDGYETTQKIREYENRINPCYIETDPKSSFNRFRIPIIAMTAHAIKGYREKCLSAGMDDYITKPLKRQAFLDTIAQWAPDNRLNQQTIPNFPVPPIEPVIMNKNWDHELPMDFEKALDEFENDREFLLEILDEFKQNMHDQLAVIDTAIENKDAETIRARAHAIKGGAANLTAIRLSTIAHELELIGKSGVLDNCPFVFKALKNEFECLKTYVNAITA